MTTGIDLRITPATREHAPFIAWVMLTAARSHLERGMWDLLTDTGEPETLRLLEALASSEDAHWAHYSLFLVAEVGGRPASALAGYLERELNPRTMMPALQAAFHETGRTDADFAQGWARAGSIGLVEPHHDEDTWIVEHVATAPEFRRQGLIDQLLAAMLDRGRARGASVADIGVLIGNARAQAAYEKAGFRVIDEKRDAAFEAAYGGCPGVRSLSRAI